MIKSLIQFFFKTNLSSAFPLLSLVVSVLSIFFLLDNTSFQLKPRKCVFLSYSRLQRGYRCYSPNTHRYFVSADVTLFKNSSMFPTTHPLGSDVISLPLLYLIQDISFVPPVHHLDHCKYILVAHVLNPGLQLTHLLWRPLS